ncbi:MAG: site-specific integrase, partial [Fuerstiella sp.]
PKTICVDTSGKFPMLQIPAAAEKGAKDRVLPMAPEFAEFLDNFSESDRTGLVFNLSWRRNSGKLARVDVVSPKIAEIGHKANVKVSDEKCASAHDLRRSFGARWANRVKPHVLQQMMRHEDIQTTMTYYVKVEADTMAEAIWSAYNEIPERDHKTSTALIQEQPQQ